MSTAIVARRDWEKLVPSDPAWQSGDFTMHAFSATAPQKLFKDFSRMPQLWGDINIPRMARQPLPLQSYWAGRTRRLHSPMGGWKERRGPDDELVTDQLRFCGGIFEESAIPPKRYVIDCVVELIVGIRPTEPAPPPLRSRLRYTGPARGVMVFSRPIDDNLVQLLILDLRPDGSH